jgi:UDP-GlcNAc:undecaprenyl-phosphate/decaprenyl-phosphate GlcNAc-1-phosphate transferase
LKTEIIHLLITYGIFFIVILFFAILINGLLVKFSGNLGTRSNTGNQVRWNVQEKPSFGGISFFIIFLISIFGLSFFFENSSLFHNVKLLGIVVATAVGFLTGLFDDSFNTKVIVKLFSQILCGVILVITGTTITLFDNNILNYVFTVLWVVGMMNSINMLDNMDGISTIVSIFIFLAIFIENVLGSGFGDDNNMLLLGIITGLIGFLVYNFPPSKMFMGDTGSQFLGVLLAAFSITYLWNHHETNGINIPAKQIVSVLLIFALPLIDTTTVTIKRILRGRSPFVGGKDHTTHHLCYLGLSDTKVAIVFFILSLVSGALGLLCLQITDWSRWHTLGFTSYFLILFTILFSIANISKPKA